MKVLITGGAGFIGSHLCDELLAREHEVDLLDNLTEQVHGSLADWPEYVDRHYLAGRVNLWHSDVRHLSTYSPEAVTSYDAIVHLAAQVGNAQAQYEVERYVDHNVRGTAVLLQLLVDKKWKGKFVVAGSMSAYGEGWHVCRSCAQINRGPRTESQLQSRSWYLKCEVCEDPCYPHPTPETIPLDPQSVYAMTKAFQESLCLAYGKAHRRPVAVARLFNVYGPRQALNNPYTGVAAIFTARVLAGRRPLIYEDGHQVRDFVHVTDVARALALLVEDSEAVGPFNVCTGNATSIASLASTIAKLHCRNDLEPEVTGQCRSGDIRACIGDPSRLRDLGWQPRIGNTAGLMELRDWSAEHKPTGDLDRAHTELKQHGLVR